MLRTMLRNAILSAAVAGTLWFANATPAAARERSYREACEVRLQNARARLDSDFARFGPRSPRVQRDRMRLEDTRRWCRSHRADWDHGRFDRDDYRR
jgi:hypothetical protein